MKYLITGGTGFIGKALCEKILEDPKSVVTILSRDKGKVSKIFNNITYIESLDDISDNEEFDTVINLAGEGIADKRWSRRQKQELVNSRVKVTKELTSLFKRLKNKPSVFISASAIGYYGSSGNETLTETSKPQNEFTHELCKSWESEAKKASRLGVRTCITRFGVVLGKNGGTIHKMITPFKLGLGGKVGNGEQFFSWVHIDDVIEAIIFLINKNKLSGSFNVTSPKAVTNSQFTKSFGKILCRPTLFHMPALVVKTIFGEMGETLLLKGQRVYPKNLLDAGFNFQFVDIENALNEIIKK